ncbi:MAG: hypothetical protein IPP31_07255 [Chitinophagaceae bacterium]|nr:hypothetical protein [Chitinophagaceae bacterium]
MRRALFLMVCSLLVIFVACKKSTEDFQTATINDYNPLVPGKYITYTLDSIVTVNFGQSLVTNSYQVRFVVDAEITDNLGRKAFRIIRYIRKTSANPWAPDNTFMAVPTENGMEFIENNLRYVKLKTPIRDGYTWKGNTYIDTYSLNSNLKYLNDWDYSFDSLDLPAKVGALTIDSTLRVMQRDEIIGDPSNPNSYSERNVGIEKYARGIGLIYRRFLHTEYQPPTPGHPGAYADGTYGVTLTMIDHN